MDRDGNLDADEFAVVSSEPPSLSVLTPPPLSLSLSLCFLLLHDHCIFPYLHVV